MQCAVLVNTNHGYVNLVLNEIDYYGEGHTIHSSGQIEWHKNTVDDKSIKVGGSQCVTTLDGYSFPLKRTGSLMYLSSLDKPTGATCVEENDLLHIDRWKRFRNLAKRYKTLTRAVKQSRIRQARRAKKYMFGYLIPRSYKEALEFDKENNSTKCTDDTAEEMDCIKEQRVFTKPQRVKWDSNHN